ncbi:MAG: hypothetical protein ABIA92_04780 [Patescibacteria group bacterium]
MAKQTKKPDGVQWTMEDLYNLLMFDIEPELMTQNIGDLDEFYADESKNERKERMERYKEAFDEFYNRFDKILDVWKGELGALKKAMFSKLKEKAMKGEEVEISDIESSIDQQ